MGAVASAIAGIATTIGAVVGLVSESVSAVFTAAEVAHTLYTVGTGIYNWFNDNNSYKTDYPDAPDFDDPAFDIEEDSSELVAPNRIAEVGEDD